MNRSIARLAVAGLSILAMGAAKPPSGHVNFVACPILRDTKTVPCWLAEFQGKTYFLILQVDATAEVYPPYLGHKALIEGVVSGEPDFCGGVVLKPIKISVIPDLDPTCNTMLPAEDRFQAPNAPRGPGPRYQRQTYGPPPGAPRAPDGALATGPRDFTVYYDFDSELGSRSLAAMQQAAAYAAASKAGHVRVVGHRASSLLSDGARAEEPEGLARRRAERLGDTLRQIGVPATAISVSWQTRADAGNGADDYKLRRAVITVSP